MLPKITLTQGYCLFVKLRELATILGKLSGTFVLFNIFHILSRFSGQGEEHLRPQWDVFYWKRPPDADTKGQETGAQGVLQNEDRPALQQHLHVKAGTPPRPSSIVTPISSLIAETAVGQGCDTLGLTHFGKASQTWSGRFKMPELKQIKETKRNTIHVFMFLFFCFF